MRRIFLAIALLGTMSPLAATSQTCAGASKDCANQLPPYVVSGLKAYSDSGPEAAVHEWLKGSPIEGNKDAEGQGALLLQIKVFYGNFKSYDVLRVRELTPKVQIAYLVMNFDSGPVFAVFTSFKTEKGWILTNFNFNTKTGRGLSCPACERSGKVTQHYCLSGGWSRCA